MDDMKQFQDPELGTIVLVDAEANESDNQAADDKAGQKIDALHLAENTGQNPDETTPPTTPPAK